MESKLIRYQIIRHLTDKGLSLRKISTVFDRKLSFSQIRNILEAGEPKIGVSLDGITLPNHGHHKAKNI